MNRLALSLALLGSVGCATVTLQQAIQDACRPRKECVQTMGVYAVEVGVVSVPIERYCVRVSYVDGVQVAFDVRASSSGRLLEPGRDREVRPHDVTHVPARKLVRDDDYTWDGEVLEIRGAGGNARVRLDGRPVYREPPPSWPRAVAMMALLPFALVVDAATLPLQLVGLWALLGGM